MIVVRTIADVRGAVASARAGRPRSPDPSARRTVGLVPTMGALHDGHVALLRRARAGCEFVVATIFVNPRQFNDPRDLAAYPRQEAQDVSIAESAGTDLLFV
ncbi:MAG TPA: pantoate--beta-alanine ligase, partial [Vicinamibacterales bacterium]